MIPKKFVAQTLGGLGKQITATGVIRELSKAFPGAIIDVMTSYPDVFRTLPFVRRVFGAGQPLPYFRDDHEDFEFLAQEPYHRLAFRQGEEHISQAWMRAFGLEAPDNPIPGIIRLTDMEHEAAMQLAGQIDRSKHWVAFQPWGGTAFYAPEAAGDILRPRQIRDLPFDIAQQIVDRLVEAGKIVIQFSLPTEKRLEKTIVFDLGKQQDGRPQILSPRVLFAILNLCEAFVGIDSAMQHAWAALGKSQPAVVLWGGTKFSQFGYPAHSNIVVDSPCPTPQCGRPDVAFPDIVDGGQTWVCPHDGACMRHNPEAVVAALLTRMAKLPRPPTHDASRIPPVTSRVCDPILDQSRVRCGEQAEMAEQSAIE